MAARAAEFPPLISGGLIEADQALGTTDSPTFTFPPLISGGLIEAGIAPAQPD